MNIILSLEEPTFKRELTPVEIAGIKAMIILVSKHMYNIVNPSSLVYTSSSSYAALWTTQNRLYKNQRIVSFTLDKAGTMFMVTEDENEDYSYYKIV